MNRAQRRALKASMRRRGHETLTLRGGPMDGWIVKRNAPALQPTWRGTWLEEAAKGLYLSARQDLAKLRGVALHSLPLWEEATEEARAEYRVVVRERYGAGRYVVRRSGLEADWVAA